MAHCHQEWARCPKELHGPLLMEPPQGLMGGPVQGMLLPLSGKVFLSQKYHTGVSNVLLSQ